MAKISTLTLSGVIIKEFLLALYCKQIVIHELKMKRRKKDANYCSYSVIRAGTVFSRKLCLQIESFAEIGVHLIAEYFYTTILRSQF